MKRILLPLAAGVLFTSCSPLLYSNYLPIGEKVQTIARGLTPTEDPATGLYGYLSDIGLWAITPQYKSAGKFQDGMARVQTMQGYGIINPLGQWIVQPVFQWGSHCDEAAQSIRKGRLTGIELWLAEDPATGRYGYLNHYGNWHIEPQYEDAGNFDGDGFAVAQPVGGKWGVINRSNQWVIQPNFDSSYQAKNALDRLKR